MNTQTSQALPDGWEALLADRWERGKVQNQNQLVHTIWEKVQIRGREETPETLTLYAVGLSAKWERAGTLKKKGDRWVYFPNKTSFASETLEAHIIKYLT